MDEVSVTLSKEEVKGILAGLGAINSHLRLPLAAIFSDPCSMVRWVNPPARWDLPLVIGNEEDHEGIAENFRDGYTLSKVPMTDEQWATLNVPWVFEKVIDGAMEREQLHAGGAVETCLSHAAPALATSVHFKHACNLDIWDIVNETLRMPPV